MNRRPLIAVDIDDVLAANAKGLVDFSNARWGTTLTPADYEEDWAVMWQIETEHARARANEFFESKMLREFEHDIEALSVLHQLKERYDLIIVTARRTQTKGDTLDWIKEKYPGIFQEDRIFFAGIWDEAHPEAIKKTKGALLKELGADYLIDDQPKHCIGALQEGVQPLLFGNYRWNQVDELPEGITRVDGWADVLEYFRDHE